MKKKMMVRCALLGAAALLAAACFDSQDTKSEYDYQLLVQFEPDEEYQWDDFVKQFFNNGEDTVSFNPSVSIGPVYHFAKISDLNGFEGGIALAEEVRSLCEQPNNFGFTYPLDMSIEDKIREIAKRVYRADDVGFDLKAEKQIKRLELQGYGNLPICMAKTQFSFSDDPTLLGAPSGFRIHVTDVKPKSGAGFIVVRTGDIMTMPGLPKRPSAENIDVDNDGRVTGLF